MTIQQNKISLPTIIAQLSSFLEDRLDETAPEALALPQIEDEHLLEALLKRAHCQVAEKLAFYLALLPHLSPGLYDEIIAQNLKKAGDFPQLGGTKGKDFRGFMPTGQTILYLLAGDDQQAQIQYRKLFTADHFFAERQILVLAAPEEGAPRMSGKVILNPDLVEQILTGQPPKPHFSMSFPAQLLKTKMEWNDLVLHQRTLSQIKALEAWVKHGDFLLQDWGMSKRVKPGYRALFHGPPGTGKTLTASLLGKQTGRDVYRVDLSMVVSKYIGETEKNLSRLFAKAENKDWILFFDEADALFGKRTGVKDAHDRFANQEVSYLLQRVESYNGLAILASNFKSNIDEAFLRRFQAVIHFSFPSVGERQKLWASSWPEQVTFDKDVSFDQLARSYEVTGSNIVNIAQKICLDLLAKQSHTINKKMLIEGIQWEMAKSGKIV